MENNSSNLNEPNYNYSNYMPDYSYQNPYEYRVGFGRRLFAFILDYLIYTLIFLVALVLSGKINDVVNIASMGTLDINEITEISKSILPLALIVSLIYYSLEAFIGATLGKLTLGIKIGNLNRENATINQLLLRYSIKNINVLLSLIGLIPALSFLNSIGSLLGIIVFIGYFFIFSEKKQALHDKIANTAVYYKDEIINN